MLNPKPLFEQRMKQLLSSENDYEKFLEFSTKKPINSIRCNTLKISVQELKNRLKKWKISQPFKDYPEAIIIESELLPGKLGNSIEHLLGYYYIQELSSMLPILALKPKSSDLFLDLCASPGSKTTQAAAFMQNSGTIIANDHKIDRIKILSANLEKCSVTNTIVTREDGINLCEKLKNKVEFNKILVDAPCSGEGTLRSSPKTFLMWNLKMIEKFSRLQKKLVAAALACLKKDGELLYSTCTHAPEENEEVLSFLLENYNVKIEKINLPFKTRPGITKWQNKKYREEVKKACRIYPQDNNTEGFFLAKIKLQEK